jgi:hypothetical protein
VRAQRRQSDPEAIAGAAWLEAELASIRKHNTEGLCDDLGASRPLSALDEPDCYEPPLESPSLKRKGDSKLDRELNEPWD